MQDTASPLAVWSLDDTVARLSCGELVGRVDAARPDMGLRGTSLDNESAPCLLFCTRRASSSRPTNKSDQDFSSWPLSVAEAYVRGNDLVASYRAVDEWPYSPQLYWQAGTLQSVDGVLGSLSHLVSVQTHLLDTHPMIQVASHVPGSELLFITSDERGAANVEPVKPGRTVLPSGVICCALRRLSAAPVSYVEIVSANDFCKVDFGADPQGRLVAEWQLFAEFLEKGVIRRARVHAALLPRENDLELALECCRAAESCSLPLTT